MSHLREGHLRSAIRAARRLVPKPMTPWLDDGDVRLYHGDNLDVLCELPDKSVHMCCTSPPFFGLRDYGTGTWEGGEPDCDHAVTRPDKGSEVGLHDPETHDRAFRSTKYAHNEIVGRDCRCGARRVDRQIGLEETPDQWVQNLVAVFREVRRVLRDDGTLWVEIGDSYVSGQGGRQSSVGEMPAAPLALNSDGDVGRADVDTGSWRSGATSKVTPARGTTDLKPKDLLGQPWLLAFALRADGWWLRSEIIWARPNPMPESVTDRPTKSHSTVFLLSKQPRYFYDADAIREPHTTADRNGDRRSYKPGSASSMNDGEHQEMRGSFAGLPLNPAGANARSVWQIPTQPTPFAHFATWPEALVRRMILAGTSERGCCPECGAPWVRETETEYVKGYRSGHLGRGRSDGNNPTPADMSGYPALDKRVTTTGWSPSCTHNLEPIPCTVLDPFTGSATTMLVARNHGRHSIGIELNESYLEIAAKRLQQLSLLA
jgi:DNA modification methylase